MAQTERYRGTEAHGTGAVEAPMIGDGTTGVYNMASLAATDGLDAAFEARFEDEDHTSDFDVVTQDPADYYARPRDILADADLTLDQKIKLLEEWKTDLSRKLESESEGMTHCEACQSEEDAAFLKEASTSLRRALGEEPGELFPSAPETVIGRMWRRLKESVGMEATR